MSAGLSPVGRQDNTPIFAALRKKPPMLKLFTAHNSICTQKVFLTLLEKELPWTSEYIDLFNNEHFGPTTSGLIRKASSRPSFTRVTLSSNRL